MMGKREMLEACNAVLTGMRICENNYERKSICSIMASYCRLGGNYSFFKTKLREFRDTKPAPMDVLYWWIVDKNDFTEYEDFIAEWYRVRRDFIMDFKNYITNNYE